MWLTMYLKIYKADKLEMTMKFRVFLYLGLILFLSCNSKTTNKTTSDITSIHAKHGQTDIYSLSDQWLGNYEGSFLRLEGESVDPRGWATVELHISKKKSTFYIFSYVEEKNYGLKIVEEKDSSITFRISDTTLNSKISLYKNNKNLEMESDFINGLLNKKQLIIMTLKDEK